MAKKTTSKKSQPAYRHEVVIDRNKWLTPDNVDIDRIGSGMVKHGGLMCCLGFHCQQVHGAKKSDMTGMAMPGDLAGISPATWHYAAANTNDNSNLTSQERERKLTTAFKRQRIKLTFTGKYRTKRITEDHPKAYA